MSPPKQERIPIWLDVDTGHDDAFAILLAAHHPSLNLLGISTTFGNAPLEQTTYNTRAILKAIGREDVPVYAGAAKPFCREAWHAPEIHGRSGLDGTTCLPVPDVPAQGNGEVGSAGVAVQAMYEALIATEPGTAWLVPTGALTNSALFFALHPDLVGHLRGVSIMGGAVGGGFNDAPMGVVDGESEGMLGGGGKGERFGNMTPFAEFNVYIDPESAAAVLGNRELAAKTTLIPLDLTHLFLATEEVQRGLRYGFDETTPSAKEQPISTVRTLFLEILTFFTATYSRVFNLHAGPPLHDPLAVAAAFLPDLFDDHGGERFEVEVLTDGVHGPKGTDGGQESQCGRTIVREVGKGGEGGGRKGVRIPRGLDGERVWRVLEGCLGRAEEAQK